MYCGSALILVSKEERRYVVQTSSQDKPGGIAERYVLPGTSTRTGSPHILLAEDDFDLVVSDIWMPAVFGITILEGTRRHSGSEAQCVELTQQNCRLHIEVRDWGSGFDPTKVGHNRFGLEGIRERARLTLADVSESY